MRGQPKPGRRARVGAVRLVKYTHACVRLEDDGRILVIDPGEFTEPHAIEGAHDVLVTHEHYDHIDVRRLTEAAAADPSLTVYAPASVAGQLTDFPGRVTTVEPGDTFTAADFAVRAVGGSHAEIYEGLPGCPNVGYALFVPDVAVEVLLVPASAPWLKLAEALDFMRAVKPARAYPIHDAMLSEIGQMGMDRWMGAKGNTEFARIPVGESVSL